MLQVLGLTRPFRALPQLSLPANERYKPNVVMTRFSTFSSITMRLSCLHLCDDDDKDGNDRAKFTSRWWSFFYSASIRNASRGHDFQCGTSPRLLNEAAGMRSDRLCVCCFFYSQVSRSSGWILSSGLPLSELIRNWVTCWISVR